MCVVSNVGDYWKDHYPKRYPWVDEWVSVGTRPVNYNEEIVKLKKEIEELKKLVKAAQKFDEATGQPHCETEDKMALIKKIADKLGVEYG